MLFYMAPTFEYFQTYSTVLQFLAKSLSYTGLLMCLLKQHQVSVASFKDHSASNSRQL